MGGEKTLKRREGKGRKKESLFENDWTSQLHQSGEGATRDLGIPPKRKKRV